MFPQPEMIVRNANAAGGFTKPPTFPQAPEWEAPTPKFPVLHRHEHSLAFGVAPRAEYQSLIRRLGADGLHSVYVLVGQTNGRPVARAGMTKDPHDRLATHLRSFDLEHLTHVAVVAGSEFKVDDAAALECIVLRQIDAMGVVNPGSEGPGWLNFAPDVWNRALTAFLFLRWGLEKARIKLLEPASPQHPASLISSAIGIRERWAPNAYDLRKNLVGGGGTAGADKIHFDLGDYITVAEKRGQDYWILAGSEIRATTFSSAREKDRKDRDNLLKSGHATQVRGFPDRIELLVDWRVGSSEDRLTKFVMATAGRQKCWHPFVPGPIEATHIAPTLRM